MDISKKDLLKMTGISYGQLYRWKREGLIPESWFVKKATATGQETFFPRELILNRIYAIQKLKDRYSLEEMAKLLSPEVSNRLFVEEDLELFSEIDIDVAADFMDALEKDNFTYMEVLIMIVFSEWKKDVCQDEDTYRSLISHMAHMIPKIDSIDYQLLLLQVNSSYYTIFVYEGDRKGFDQGLLYLDDRIEIIREVHLQEISNHMKVTYKDTFSFTFDEEVTGGTYEQ